MEKDFKLLENDELPIRQSNDAPRRYRRYAIAGLLFFAFSFWYTRIQPALTIGRHGGCTQKHTVEERAARILKKHPLIGQHYHTNVH
jgi:hypothetical protein